MAVILLEVETVALVINAMPVHSATLRTQQVSTACAIAVLLPEAKRAAFVEKCTARARLHMEAR